MAKFDLVVRGGTVVDGTGSAPRRIDVAVRDGRVAAVGRIDASDAAEVFDADGLIVAPGVVDVHTHYDPQMTFEPLATMSSYHGVTTVLAGNCGFSIAPTAPRDRDFIAALFAKVEQMHPSAMSAIKWDFETFPEYMKAREGNLGINLACYVGHSNIRRWVMGAESSERTATATEIGAMAEIVRDAMRGGAAGFSSSHAPTHLDGDDRPVPSRQATHDELLTLCAAAGETGSGTIGYLPFSSIGGLDENDEDLLIRIGEVSGLPVVIQGLGGRNKVDAPTATWERAVEFLNRASANGTPVYSMLISRPPDRPMRVAPGNFHFLAAPSWDRMLQLPHDDRAALLRSDAGRAELRTAVENYNRDPAKGTTTPPPMWNTVIVDHVKAPQHRGYEGRTVASIAQELGVQPADAMLDIALAEDFETEFRWSWETDEWRSAVAIAQLDYRMVPGVSDGGAHLARDDGADWSSWFIRNWILEREVWSLEEGIRRLTALPAALAGFSDRGSLEVGKFADIFVFDLDTIGAGRKEFVHDLPGGAGRFKAGAQGVKATIVNGVPVIVDGLPTGALPGHTVRPSRVS